MASYQSLGQELECPICLEYPKDPKVMGKCLHAACLGCLKIFVAGQGSKSFPCPVCQEECMVPSNGVAGLKDDFRLRSLVEKYQQMKKDRSIIHCTACRNPACHFCKKCDKIYLCMFCSIKHSQDPLTAAHEVVVICSKHGKKLTMYCRKCGTAICSACRIADHPRGSHEHDVAPHQEVADQEANALVDVVKGSDRTLEQKEKALGNIIVTRDSVVATINSDLVELGRQSDSAIAHTQNKHAQLKAERNNIHEQIEALMKRKNTVDKEIAKIEEKETSLRQENEQLSIYLNHYREKRMNEFLVAVTQAAAETDEIRANVDLGREETSSKRVLDNQTVPTLVKVKEKLTKTITAAQQIDRVAPFVDVKERMVRFVPNGAPMEIGFIRMKEFSKLTKFADISLPADRRSDQIWRVQHADGRLASLYESDYDNDSAVTINLHDPATPAVPRMIIDKNIHPAFDMAVTSKGELMVLRRAEPVVRVFNAHNGDFRDINISVGKIEIDTVMSIETDEEGNIFVLDTDGHLRLFNPDGKFINEAMVKIRIALFARMSYCRFKRTLYIVNRNDILRYHWGGTVLKEMASLAHDVNGFMCTDVCTGDEEEVFVGGFMKCSSEIRIYQVVVDQPTHKKEHALSSTDKKELCGSDLGARKDEEALCGSDLGARKDEEALCGSDLGARKDEEALCGSDQGAGKVDDRIDIKIIRLNFDDGKADRRSDWYPFISVFWQYACPR